MDPQPNRGPSILVVEDETLVRMGVAEHLRDAGFTVIEAASGDEARVVLEAGVQVDLVFSDITMPGGVDGVGLAAWIGQLTSPPALVLTSGIPSALYAAQSAHPHIRATLSKPYSYDDVERIMRELTTRA
jgi:two-component system, response regulator PdtaR